MAPRQKLPLSNDVSVVPTSSDPTSLEIAIVGAGVAGIVTARVLKGQGFSDLTVFEAGTSVSGVWSQGYPGFGIQTPGKLYEFPDKELPTPKDYKSGDDVRAYCEEYCTEHDLWPMIKLNTKVTAINGKDTPSGKKWLLTTKASDGLTSTQAFDFVVLATGIYSPNLKHIPAIPGMEHFKGKICHSQDSADWNATRQGKKVAVVG